MRETNEISSVQIRGLIVSTVIGAGILSLPNKMAIAIGNDGWIPIILGGIFSIITVLIINKIFQIYPNKDFFEIGREALGKWIFNFFIFIFFIYNMTVMASLARNLAELVKAFLLETTPPEVLIITFILATTYIARSEIQIIGRLGYHIYPIIIVSIIILIIFSLPSIDYTNALPVFQFDISKLPKAVLDSYFSFVGFEILLFAIPFAEDRNNNSKIVRTSISAIIIVTIIYLVVFFLTLSQYGLHSLQRQAFPTISLIKEIDLPGFFIENLDGVAMAIWTLVIFATMAPTYYSAGKILSNLLAVREHGFFIISMIPIIYIFSLIPQDVLQIEKILGTMINYLGIISVVILPTLIYLIGLFKVRRQADE